MERITITVHHFVTMVTVLLTLTALIIASLAISGHIDYKDNSIEATAINNHSGLFEEHPTGNTPSAVIDAVLSDGELGAQVELNAVTGDNTLSLGGVAVIASAAEINSLSGVNKQGTGFNVGKGGVVMYDSDGSNYLILDSPASVTTNYTLTFPSTVAAGYLKADAAGTITFAAANDNPKLQNVQNGDASSTITLTNNAAMTFGTTVGKLQLKAATDVELNPDSGIIKLIDNVTTFGALTQVGNELVIKSGTGTATAMTFSGADVTHSGSVTVGVDDTGHDVKFFGATSGAYMLWDESDDDLKLVGGAGLVQSGAGANTLTGATTFSNTVTVGVDDTGYDVKFFGATSGAYMEWDESDDDLKLVGGAGLVQSGSGANTLTGTTTFSNTVTVGVDGTGYDVRFYGDTASAYMGWDQSLDDLMLVGAAGLNQSGTGNVAFGGATTFSNTVTVGVNDTGYDVKFFGATSGAYMLWDESDDDLKLVGGAGLVQSGVGANTLTGATTFSNTVTVGVNDTGYDVKFFGATSGAYMLWDESDDDLKLVGGAGLVQSGVGANTLTGATTFSNTVTVGVNDTGYDVKFFGATSGAYMLWDESNDQLKLINAAGSVGEPLLHIDNNDTGNALKIDSTNTVGNTIHVQATHLTAGGILNIESTSGETHARSLVTVHNNDTAAVGATALTVTNEAVASTAGQTVLFETTVASETNPLLRLKNSNADANGPILLLDNSTGTAPGSNNDVCGTINFNANDNQGTAVNQSFATVKATALAVASGSEQGQLTIGVACTDDGGVDTVLTIEGGTNAAGSTTTISGGLIHGSTQTKIANGALATLTSAMSGSVFTVDITGAAVAQVLPTPVVGMEYTFVIHDDAPDNAFTLATSNTSTIFMVGVINTRGTGATALINGVTFANGTSHSKVTFAADIEVGSFVRVKCISTTLWFVEGLATATTTAAIFSDS